MLMLIWKVFCCLFFFLDLIAFKWFSVSVFHFLFGNIKIWYLDLSAAYSMDVFPYKERDLKYSNRDYIEFEMINSNRKIIELKCTEKVFLLKIANF